jgi:hypothetical protein
MIHFTLVMAVVHNPVIFQAIMLVQRKNKQTQKKMDCYNFCLADKWQVQLLEGFKIGESLDD